MPDGRAADAQRRRPGARAPVPRLLRRPRRRSRTSSCARRSRTRSTASSSSRTTRARASTAPATPGRGHPAGDAGALAPGRARVRPRAGARASRRGRLSRTARACPELELVVPQLAPAGGAPRRAVEAARSARRASSPAQGHVDWDALGDAHMWWTGWTADYPGPRRLLPRPAPLGQLAVLPRRRHPRAPRARAARSATRASACASTTRSTVSGWASARRSSRRLPALHAPAPPVGPGPVGEPALAGPPGHGRGRERSAAEPESSAVPVPDEA